MDKAVVLHALENIQDKLEEIFACQNELEDMILELKKEVKNETGD